MTMVSGGLTDRGYESFDDAMKSRGGAADLVPTIDLAAKQMCMEAVRTVIAASEAGWPKDVLATLEGFGHCLCISGDWLGRTHRFCCKCGDRYAVEQAQEPKES